MKRSILACVAGFVAWILVVSVLNRGLRLFLDGYALAEPTMAFTLSMMAARLTIGALTSLIAGAVVGFITPSSSTRAAWTLGTILFVMFLPVHIWLWSKFPVWYHATFLLTLIPLIVAGSKLAQRARRSSTLSPAPVESRGSVGSYK